MIKTGVKWFTASLPVLVFVLFVAIPTAYSASLERGHALHDENCKVCHDSSYYTRSNRRVKSLEKLRKQVDRCQADTGNEWSKQQINDVMTYLNTQYYKFK